MAEAPAKFQVGDNVRWTSSNTKKIGVVTHVVPSGKLPRDVGADVKGTGAPRKHETYVVRGKKLSWTKEAPYGSNANYWPLVSLLVAA